MCLAEETCPAGWTVFSGFCYFFSSEVKSWEASRQSCRQAGADLVVVHTTEEQVVIFTRTLVCWRLSLISDQRSAAVWMVLILFCYAEQNFLAKHITGNAWIGLTDIETEGTWKWVDGNPLTAGYLSPDYPSWATVESRLCLL